MIAHDPARMLTPPQVARRLAVKVDRVRRWITAGQLRGINLGDGSRPRWRIDPADLEAFLARRTASPAPRQAPRRRRKPANVIEYY